MDPPQHTEFRRLLAPFFTPKSISNLEIRARELTLSMLERFADKGACEFVSEFALTMPIGIFMSLVDLPDTDRLLLLDISERMVRPASAEVRVAAFHEAYAYLAVKFEERRHNPGSDVLSALLAARVEGGRPLTQVELLNTGALLLAGGLDTVAAQMGFTMMYLARHPAQRKYLVENPDQIPAANEELLRRHSTANVSRMVTRDLVYKGVTMKAGDMVLTSTSVASLDDRHYADPMALDFNRSDKKSLAFGRGPHQCIGAFLARTELKVFLTEWLRRIPDFAIKPGETPRVVSGSSNSVLYLPLVWEPAR
jgi:cytochrome P450